MYANPQLVGGVTAGGIVGSEVMLDRKGHCPMMLTVDVKVREPGEEEEEERESDEMGVSLPPPVRWPDDGEDDRWH